MLNKDSYIGTARRLEYQKTGKARDIATESKRSSNPNCKDQANH